MMVSIDLLNNNLFTYIELQQLSYLEVSKTRSNKILVRVYLILF